MTIVMTSQNKTMTIVMVLACPERQIGDDWHCCPGLPCAIISLRAQFICDQMAK
jgi:hypothetical protein